MNTFNHYLSFTAEGFSNDPSFWNWVLEEGTREEVLFWEAFYTLHPTKHMEIEEARQNILILNEQSFFLPEKKVNRLWQRIAAGMAEPGSIWVSLSRMGVAASFAGLLLTSATAVYLIRESSYTRIQTDYGARKQISLPDGSSVILNGNSSIRYAAGDFNTLRQVWIRGEAFFNVVHTSHHQRFVVHTDEVDIQVLGTSFDVKSRDKKIDVVLSTGKIKLHINDTRKQLTMSPGEHVRYSGKVQKIEKEKVNVSKYISWRQNTLIFENDSLAYVFDVLRDNYNMQLKVEDQGILKRKITAKVPADQPELLLKGLSEAHGLKFVRQKGGWLVTYN